MARHTVERLTESPVKACTHSQRSWRLAKGRFWRSSAISLMAFSSSLGAEPGLFFGASDSPRPALSVKRLTEERLTPKVCAA
jgi:hypothetical protein